MASPSSILQLRLQTLGENVNTWGGYLNTALQMVEQASKGYQALAVTADATISWTNYVTGNTGECAAIKLTGTLAAAAALTFPSNQNFMAVWNTAGATVTIKCSSGTGVAIPTGYRALIFCDGTDYYNIGPQLITGDMTTTGALTLGGAITLVGQIHGLVAGSAATDAVNVTQLAAAIAASVPLGTAGTALNSVTDTTRDYISSKVIPQITGLTTTQLVGLVSVQTQSAGGNEKLAIAGYVGGFLDGGVKAAQFTPLAGYAYDVDCTSAGVTVNLTGMTTPQVGQEIKLNKFGTAGNMFLLGTVNSGSNLSSGAPNVNIFRYCGSSWGWN